MGGIPTSMEYIYGLDLVMYREKLVASDTICLYFGCTQIIKFAESTDRVERYDAMLTT